MLVAAAAAAAGADPEPGLNFSTSALVMRPPSPVPLTSLRGMPRSSARRLARGEAATPSSRAETVSSLPPVLEDSSALGAGVGSDSAGGSEAGDGSSLGGGAGADSPPASAMVKSANAATSSAFSTMTAMG